MKPKRTCNKIAPDLANATVTFFLITFSIRTSPEHANAPYTSSVCSWTLSSYRPCKCHAKRNPSTPKASAAVR